MGRYSEAVYNLNCFSCIGHCVGHWPKNSLCVSVSVPLCLFVPLTLSLSSNSVSVSYSVCGGGCHTRACIYSSIWILFLQLCPKTFLPVCPGDLVSLMPVSPLSSWLLYSLCLPLSYRARKLSPKYCMLWRRLNDKINAGEVEPHWHGIFRF